MYFTTLVLRAFAAVNKEAPLLYFPSPRRWPGTGLLGTRGGWKRMKIRYVRWRRYIKVRGGDKEHGDDERGTEE